MISTADLAPYAGFVLRDASFPELPNHYRGKVRENYDLPDWRRDRSRGFLPGWLVLFAVLLGGEWFLRRTWGMV